MMEAGGGPSRPSNNNNNQNPHHQHPLVHHHPGMAANPVANNNNHNNNNYPLLQRLPSAASASNNNTNNSHHQHHRSRPAPIPRLRLERQCLRWSRVPMAPSSKVPPPRSGAASVVAGGKLWVFGGYGGGTGRLDDFYSYDFDTKVWEEVTVKSQEKPGCRENNGVVISDSSDSIYLFGGYDGSQWLNDLWQFHIATQRWTCIQESSDTTSPADALAAAGQNNVNAQNNNNQNNSNNVSNNNNNNNYNQNNNNNHGISDPSQQPSNQQFSSKAKHVQGKVPSRRFGYVSVVHAGKLIVWAGFDGSRWLNCMYVFDFATKTWSEIQAEGQLPSVRSCPAWAKDETHVYIQGGYDGIERKTDFWACDLTDYTWTQMPSFGTPPTPRYFHSCALFGNKLYVYGGYSGNERLSDMYAYDFETNHWSEVNCTSGDAPSGRSSLVAQIYGSALYVFGGYDGSSVLDDFHCFRLRAVAMPPPSLVSDFRRLINNPELADVRFIVEDQEVYAHRAVLASRSEYFRVMLLTGGMRESSRALESAMITDESTSSGADNNNNNKPNAPIHLQDVSYDVFLQVLEFLYTDTVTSVSLETGIHLMIASEHFMLDRLKALCEDVIRRDIDLDNCIGILVASHRHHASNLKEIALEYIIRNLSSTVIRNGLSDLKPEPDLLVEILQRTTSTEGSAGNRGNDEAGLSLSDQFGAGAGWANARR